MSAAHPSWPDNRSLSNREREIAGLLADGLRTDQVARLLKIAPTTVNKYVSVTMEKCGVYSRRGLIAWVKQQRAA